MPWITILLAILSFFAQKKAGASNTKALVTAGLVGGAAYYVTHETDWGKANLGDLDGVPAATTEGSVVTDEAENTVINPDTGLPIRTGGSTGVFDVLKSWGATGTAKVIGTAGLTANASSILSSPVVLIGLVIGVILLASK